MPDSSGRRYLNEALGSGLTYDPETGLVSADVVTGARSYSTSAMAFYVDPENGDDDNDGLSWDEPWETWAGVAAYLKSYILDLGHRVTVYMAPGTHKLVRMNLAGARDYVIGYPDETQFPATDGTGVYTLVDTFTTDTGTDENTLVFTEALPVLGTGPTAIGLAQGASCRIVDGDAAGERKTLKLLVNTDVPTDTAYPSKPFSVSPGVGTSVEIFTPECRLEPPDEYDGEPDYAYPWLTGPVVPGQGGVCVVGCALAASDFWYYVSVESCDLQLFGCAQACYLDPVDYVNAPAAERGLGIYARGSSRAWVGEAWPVDWQPPLPNLGGTIPGLDDASKWDGWGLAYGKNGEPPYPDSADAKVVGTLVCRTAYAPAVRCDNGMLEVNGGVIGSLTVSGKGRAYVFGWDANCPVHAYTMEVSEPDARLVTYYVSEYFNAYPLQWIRVNHYAWHYVTGLEVGGSRHDGIANSQPLMIVQNGGRVASPGPSWSIGHPTAACIHVHGLPLLALGAVQSLAAGEAIEGTLNSSIYRSES